MRRSAAHGIGYPEKEASAHDVENIVAFSVVRPTAWERAHITVERYGY
jgi:hypothetical protein